MDPALNYTIEIVRTHGIKNQARIFFFFFGGKQSLQYSHPPLDKIPNFSTPQKCKTNLKIHNLHDKPNMCLYMKHKY